MKYVVISAVVIVIVFLVVLSYIPIGIEPLSEVYFENHTKLPVNIFLNRSYNFTFTVHNLEYRDMTYNYNITSNYGNKSLTVDSGTFALSNNESVTLLKKFKMLEHFDRAQILVNVTKDNNESIDIHFWVDEIIPIRITIERNNTNSSSNNVTK